MGFVSCAAAVRAMIDAAKLLMAKRNVLRLMPSSDAYAPVHWVEGRHCYVHLLKTSHSITSSALMRRPPGIVTPRALTRPNCQPKAGADPRREVRAPRFPASRHQAT